MKIINRPYLECRTKRLTSEYVYENILHIFKRHLCEKYQGITFEFFLSRRAKNVHMGLNCSLSTLREHEKIISDIEEIWLLKDKTRNLNL